MSPKQIGTNGGRFVAQNVKVNVEEHRSMICCESYVAR
jgi:hypothetical protein